MSVKRLYRFILNAFKQATFVVCLVFASQSAFAEPQIIADNDLLLDTAKEKINEISLELFKKTGISIIIYAKKSLNNETILNYEQNISSTLKEPYVLIVFAEAERKVDIMSAPENLAKIVDKNFVLNNRIIPIISSTDDKNSPSSRYSAALLNGVGEIADRVAEAKGVTLDSSLGSQNIITMNVIRFIFYGTIVFSIGVLVYRKYFS